MTFTYVGRLVDRKRVDVFLKALHILRSKGYSNYVAYVVGSGPAERDLRSLANKLNLQGKVRFTGYVDQNRLVEILGSSDVFVLPSIYESWGFAIYEAAAYGCAPVATDLPFFSSSMKDGENALLFKPSDEADLASKLILLYNDRILLSKIKAEAKKMSSGYRWEDSIDKILRIYSSICDNPLKKTDAR